LVWDGRRIGSLVLSFALLVAVPSIDLIAHLIQTTLDPLFCLSIFGGVLD